MSVTSDWPEDITLPGPPEHLLALGAFALQYNQLEMLLYSFLRCYFPKNSDACGAVFSSLHNRGRVELIRTFAASEPDEALKAAVLHAMQCFELCAENRNLLLHGFPDERPTDGTLTILKASANKPTLLKYYRFELDDVRQAAISTARVFRYCVGVVAWMKVRETEPDLAKPLPDKPQLPRKLNLSQLREDPQAAPPLPAA